MERHIRKITHAGTNYPVTIPAELREREPCRKGELWTVVPIPGKQKLLLKHASKEEVYLQDDDEVKRDYAPVQEIGRGQKTLNIRVSVLRMYRIDREDTFVEWVASEHHVYGVIDLNE